MIASGDDWPDSARFARQREGWLRRFLARPGGVPSHDTFERVVAALDVSVFERCCLAWLHAAAQPVGVGPSALDGKAVTGSAAGALAPLHLVSAWATQAQLSLGPVAVDGQSNEITAIPRLLERLDLHGALVTIDAIGCQEEIATKVVSGGGDDVLVVKANRERRLQAIQETVGRGLGGALPAATVRQSTTTDQGTAAWRRVRAS
jgi:hypothetical protein